MYKLIIFFLLSFSYTFPVYAYLGPGLGGGIIAATLGIIVAIFAAIFGLIWFPLKKYFKNKKNKKLNRNQPD